MQRCDAPFLLRLQNLAKTTRDWCKDERFAVQDDSCPAKKNTFMNFWFEDGIFFQTQVRVLILLSWNLFLMFPPKKKTQNCCPRNDTWTAHCSFYGGNLAWGFGSCIAHSITTWIKQLRHFIDHAAKLACRIPTFSKLNLKEKQSRFFCTCAKDISIIHTYITCNTVNNWLYISL